MAAAAGGHGGGDGGGRAAMAAETARVAEATKEATRAEAARVAEATVGLSFVGRFANVGPSGCGRTGGL